MEIRVLKYFLTIVNEGTITGASEVLHITQPTLTRQIHDLEKELNCKLFIRTKKKIQLTREGALFKENVIDILNKVDETQSRFTKFNKSISGNVNIGGNESFQICALAKVIKAVQKEYPNIRINLHTGSIKDIINLLDENKLDFASVV